MQAFYNWIVSYFKNLWKTITDYFTWLSDAYDSMVKFLLELPQWTFAKFADALVAYYNSIPVPDFFAMAQSAFSSIPAEVIFFAEAFQIGPGVSMVLGSYLLRFILRRIPIIG